MKIIIPDTNVLMAIGEFKMDIFSELEQICDFKYEIGILDKVETELKKILREQTRKNREAAKLALKIIERMKIKKIKTSSGKVDDLIVELSKNPEVIIATQDKELKERIKKVKGRIITIRQKKKLVWG